MFLLVNFDEPFMLSVVRVACCEFLVVNLHFYE